MNANNELAALADLCGIMPSFYEANGTERVTSPETQRALLAANGVDVSSDDAIRQSLADMRHAIEDRWFPEEIILQSQQESPQNFGLGATWQLRVDGCDAVVAQGLPSDHITLPPLPSGVYELTATASGRTEIVTVLVAPERLPSIQSLTDSDRLWGINFALYGLRSKRNAGLGDFVDLGDFAEITAKQGVAFLGINPLHNMGFDDHIAISPYSPSHRGFLNTSYIALDTIPGVAATDRADFETLRQSSTVAYQAHKTAHNQKLSEAYKIFQATAPQSLKSDFAEFQAAAPQDLLEFAGFEATSALYGPDWRKWPDAPEAIDPEHLEFHLWLQWVAEIQLFEVQARARAAGMPLGLYLDLAVGPRRDGAESRCESDVIATGVSIGAPPDHLSPEGQNWQLAAFSPRKLKAQRYTAFRRILAQTMRYAGVIRIDHVLGLNRSFWIPDDGSPGAYIRQPFESLLAIIKIEAERHNCVVIGEDLGLVPEGFRETMRHHGFYGYSVMQYEKNDHGGFRDTQNGPTQVLSCFATHDTPTVAGFQNARDIDWWQELAWIDEGTAQNMRAQRSHEVASLGPAADFAFTVHGLLADSNAGLVAVQFDDILSEVEAQNLPGTIDEHPNWRRKYSLSLEDMPGDDRLVSLANLMRNAGRARFKAAN
ncbi:4-alpha-glucanotransferase [Cognatishimia sp. WU-CL00825]|uniref:4-alpha-glucanotransferase n=1 Tax=Cognatishimia sp. WU-CL00825 TaxID=3127658 RepID=UPI003108F144